MNHQGDSARCEEAKNASNSSSSSSTDDCPSTSTEANDQSCTSPLTSMVSPPPPPPPSYLQYVLFSESRETPTAASRSESVYCSSTVGSTPTASSLPSSSADDQKNKQRQRPSHRPAIPRPPNAWILYRSAKIKEVGEERWKEEYDWCKLINTEYAEQSTSKVPAMPLSKKSAKGFNSLQSYMSKRVGEMWRAEKEQVKGYYHELAQQKKELHSQMYPGYKFRPNRPYKTSVPKEEEEEEEGGGGGGGGGQEVKMSECDTHKQAASTIQTFNDGNSLFKEYSMVMPNDDERNVSTAKIKARGPPGLSIDVVAAEMTATTLPFQPCGAVRGETPACATEMTIDFLLREELHNHGCLDATPLTGSLPWTTSPAPITPSDVELGKSEASRKSATRTLHQRASRRKSTSSAAATRGSRSATRDGISPKKKLKRATIGRDNSRLALCKKRGEEEKKLEHEAKDKQIDSNLESKSGQDQLETLQRSYDRGGGATSDEEAIKLCAESLLESFASMPAWSPEQACFSTTQWCASNQQDMSYPDSAPAAPSNTCTAAPSSWAMYQHPVLGNVSALSQYQWPSNQQAVHATVEHISAHNVQAEFDQMHNGSCRPPADLQSGQHASQEVASSLLTVHDAMLGLEPFPKSITNETAGVEKWLTDEGWAHLLAEAVVAECSEEAEEKEKETPDLEMQPQDSVWDLIRFDTPSNTTDHMQTAVLLNDSQEKQSIASPLSNSASSPSIGVITEEPPTLELHGTFTAEQLLEKLHRLQERQYSVTGKR